MGGLIEDVDPRQERYTIATGQAEIESYNSFQDTRALLPPSYKNINFDNSM